MLWSWIAGLGLLLGAERPEWQAPEEAARAAQKLSLWKGHPVEVEWNAEAGTPSKLTGAMAKPSKHTPEWIAYDFLERAKVLYGLKRVREETRITETSRSDSGWSHVRVERLLYGRPVCGDQLTLELDPSGVIVKAEGVFHSGLEARRLHRPMYPALSPERAAETVMQHAGLSGIQDEPQVNACYLPGREGVPLVYRVRLKQAPGTADMTWTVHSMTGRVIEGG
ncbi:hypothetical protein [Gorillibacterium sp. sgz5001074]|uniref:hypothetical protein n=1 Tax=Gorillibacterium sp. sgz5001074 TaxID=3446695 RepID=UPI003F676035